MAETERSAGQSTVPNVDRVARTIDGWNSERPDLSGSVQRIRARLVYLGAAVGRANHRIALGFGITGAELRILYALRRTAPTYTLRPMDLQAALLVPSPTLTRQIDRLVSIGLVTKSPDASDRRSCLAALTVEGAQVANAALTDAVENSAISKAIGSLGKNDQELLDRLLSKINDFTESL